MKGPELLKHYEDNWETEMGAWFPGERVVLRGKSVLDELSDYRWSEYLLFGITGQYSPKLARLIEGMWLICTSFPDPRLWNNRVAALAATTRSTGVLGSTAGLAVSEATIYGLKPIQGVMDFLYRLDSALESGESLEAFVKAEMRKYRGIYGFGRPVVDQDERARPLMDFARSLGAGEGKYISLAFEVDEYLSNSRYKYRINASGIVAGLLADEGVSTRELYHIATLTFTAGVIPCFIDGLTKPEGSFFPLSISRVSYDGDIHKRTWGAQS